MNSKVSKITHIILHTRRSAKDVDARAEESSWFNQGSAPRPGQSDPAMNKWLNTLAKKSEAEGFIPPEMKAQHQGNSILDNSGQKRDDDVPQWFMRSNVNKPLRSQVIASAAPPPRPSRSTSTSLFVCFMLLGMAVGAIVTVSRRISLQKALQEDNAHLRQQIEKMRTRRAGS